MTGEILHDAVCAKCLSPGGSDAWGWNDFRALLVGLFGSLAAILVLVVESGVWLIHQLYTYVVMTSQRRRDPTPIGRLPLSVLPRVHGLWATV